MPERRVDRRFYEAFTDADVTSRRPPLNAEAGSRELRDAVEAAGRLSSYRRFLAEAREEKARRGGVSLAFEREVLAQTDAALNDAHRVFAPVLRAARHVHNGGVLDDALDRWMRGVEQAGTVRLQDVWADAHNDPAVHEAFLGSGISEQHLAEIDAELQRFEFTNSVEAGRLVIEIRPAGAGRGSRLVLGRPRRGGLLRTVDELLAQGRFDETVETFSRTGMLTIDVVSADDAGKTLDLLDGLLAGVAAAMDDLARHRRSLADTGLATHVGSDPGAPAIIAIIAGAILALAIIVKYACHVEALESEPVCTAADIILVLAFLALSVSTCVAIGEPLCKFDPTTPPQTFVAIADIGPSPSPT